MNVNESSSTTELSPTSSASSSSNEPSSNNSTEAATTFEDDYDEVSSNESQKSDVENIQDESEESQENDRLEEQFARSNKSFDETIKVFQDPVVQQPNIHSGHITLIFAGTLVVLSVIAYAGLVLWRSHLEKRYGMRQRLVTEDVFYSDNQNDVRYFGL